MGTNNVLNVISQKCKIIFPSTHVIYEGLNETRRNIEENEKPCPILVYSSSKVQNEKDIRNSNKNYVILRLGSVYGYSTDTMRINIMPNLFSKISAQNGTISLFSGGQQLKSLVSIFDVVRCMKFMAENVKINCETFNLVKDSVTVKEVAEICKKYNPKTSIKITEDQTPNLGYTLSNKKLLTTGFKFLYSLEESISEMIRQWSYKKKSNNELEYKKRGEKEFIDKRGKISNYELTEPINLIGYIESVKGSMRANHYHPIQEQKVLLVKGQFISLYKNLLEKKALKITHVINEGDSVITKPNVAHTMVFTKDSIFLNLVRGEREHENYGVTHTLPYPLVSDEEKKELLNNYKLNCRCCGNNNLKRVISLGYQPLANNLLKTKNQKDETYPLEMNYCLDCYNCQLSYVVNPKKLFSNYLYLSSTASSFVKHFKIAAEKYIKEFKLKANKTFIIDVGSNDGVALKPFKDKKFKHLLGIEPAKNLANLANKKGIKTYNGFLDKKIFKKIKKKADIILASNVFAHSDDIKMMTSYMLNLLKNDGILIIEIQYLLNTLKDLTFDNIYHEHVNYWSLITLKIFFKKFDAVIFNAEKIDTHGGSLRIYVKKDKKIKINSNVKKLLNEEEKFGLNRYETYKIFAQKIYKIKKKVVSKINQLKNEKNKIIGYGSPAKATAALNFFGISNEIDCIVEDNKLKQGKFLPGMRIPIISKENLKNKPNYALVLAWNFFDEIKKNNKNLADKFVSIKDLEI